MHCFSNWLPASNSNSKNNFKSSLWWMCVSRSDSLSETDKSSASLVELLWVSSNLFKSLIKLYLLEAVICRPSVFPEKSLSSGSNTTLLGLRVQSLIASSTLGITKLFIRAKIALCTLVSTGASTLSISYRTFSVIFPSSVCMLTWEVVKWSMLLKAIFSPALSTPFVFWLLPLVFLYNKIICGLIYLTKNFPFICQLLRVETILVPITKLGQRSKLF